MHLLWAQVAVDVVKLYSEIIALPRSFCGCLFSVSSHKSRTALDASPSPEVTTRITPTTLVSLPLWESGKMCTTKPVLSVYVGRGDMHMNVSAGPALTCSLIKNEQFGLKKVTFWLFLWQILFVLSFSKINVTCSHDKSLPREISSKYWDTNSRSAILKEITVPS